MTEFSNLFTNRQLFALSTLSELVDEARGAIVEASTEGSDRDGRRLRDGGTGAEAYADAVATYLAFGVDRLTGINSSISRWNSATSKEGVTDVFSRQAIAMAWEYAEGNIFGYKPCDIAGSTQWISEALDRINIGIPGVVQIADASTRSLGYVISTDPPYYDNIVYSDLSDFFYVWLRRSLRNVFPDELSTILVPKDDELVANSQRKGGKQEAQSFFENGFRAVFSEAQSSADNSYPATVYYAFKQQENDTSGTSSTGWETLLSSLIASGWQITATWPMRSERGGRMRAVDSNALASSIVLALRPRPDTAPRIDRRGFLARLRSELPNKLRELQQGSIAPVDLPQAAIGPGMAIFSEYSAVLEDSGSKMTVRTALERINVILDEVLGELENDFDGPTRFALTWFRQNGFETGVFGDAENIANARGISLDALERSGILTKGGGKLTLIAPTAMPADYDPSTDTSISEWEVVMHLVRVLDSEGIPSAAQLLARVPSSIDTDLCRELASLLFKLAEDRKSTSLANSFNGLGAAWHEIARQARTVGGQQAELDF